HACSARRKQFQTPRRESKHVALEAGAHRAALPSVEDIGGESVVERTVERAEVELQPDGRRAVDRIARFQLAVAAKAKERLVERPVAWLHGDKERVEPRDVASVHAEGAH